MWGAKLTDAEILASVQPSDSEDKAAGEEKKEWSDCPEPSTKDARETIDM